jgi:glycosyltransferase involved in cell wall biosynthesis
MLRDPAPMRLLFYWVPDEILGAPDQITLRLWNAIQPIAGEYGLGVFAFSTARELRSLVRLHGRPQLVHFGTTPMIKLTRRARAVGTCLALRLPLSTHVHGDTDAELRFLWTHRRRHAIKVAASYALSARLLRRFQLVVVNSRALATKLGSSHAIADRIHVLPNPVDVSFWSAPLPASTREPYVFSHGRLVPEKGFDILIAAMSRIGMRQRLVIAGTGPVQVELERLAARAGIALDLIGHQPPERIRELLRGASIAAYPSRQDVFSLAALEALLAAKHVVVSEVAGVLEFMPQVVARAIRVAPTVEALAARLSAPPAVSLTDVATMFTPDAVARRLASAMVETMARRSDHTDDSASATRE